MINLSKYEIKYNPKKGIYYVWADEAIVCPVCRYGDMRQRGWRKRSYISAKGERKEIYIRRLQCKKCKTIHHELPGELVPYKRHCAETVAKIVRDDTSDVCCEESTVLRIKAWWYGMRQYIKGKAAALKEKYGINMTSETNPVEIVRALANTHLWPRTRSAFMPR